MDSSTALHPLVVMNMSDHYTRAQYRQKKKAGEIRVVGLILGRQSGHKLELCNTIELLETDGQVDVLFGKQREERYKEMYDDLEVVGWYLCD